MEGGRRHARVRRKHRCSKTTFEAARPEAQNNDRTSIRREKHEACGAQKNARGDVASSIAVYRVFESFEDGAA